MDEYFKYPGQSFEDRINWVKALILLIVFFIGLRAVYLQVIEHDKFDQMAQDKARKIKTVSIQRGKITDAEGDLLAVSLPVYSTFAYPEKFESPEKTRQILSTVLQTDPISSNKTGFTWVKRYITDSQYEVLNKLKLPGVYFEKEFMRVFPRKFTASQLLGLVGLDSIGRDGLEFQYDNYLMGKSGNNPEDAPIERYYSQGNHIQLTISQKIQYFTERSLKNSVIKSQSKTGIVIVMESKTGAILAMAGYPSFDPNRYDKYSKELYINKAINTAYEPGSTFKVITMAIARQLDIIQSDSKFNGENGAYKISDKVLRDVKPYGILPLKDIIRYSSNIGILKIGGQIDSKVFYDWIFNFGFGKKTLIDLPGESSGIVHDYRTWSELDQAVLSYGHYIQVTPIQLISAINVIANGGVFVSPYVVEKITDPGNNVIFTSDKKSKRVIDEAIALEMNEYMQAVVEKKGTGYSAAIDGIKVAGKTGTTKKFDKKKGEYSSENLIRSFVGFLPAEDPSITILAILNEPREKYRDSLSAAPLFKEIATNAFRFYTKKQSTKFINTEKKYDFNKIFGSADKVNSVSDMKNKSLREALYYSSLNKKKLIATGSGKVKDAGYIDSDKLSVILR